MAPVTKRKNSKNKASYSVDDMINAVAEVKNKSLTIKKAAEKYGIPNSTLGDRLSGRFNLSLVKPG